MPNDRIRQKMKAAGKNLRDIIRERNETMAAYVYALCSIKKIGCLSKEEIEQISKKHKKSAQEYASTHQDDLLQKRWKI